MSDVEAPQDEVTTETEESRIPREPAPPIESRFLFVDVAALRAKQLRRGAKPRITDEHLEGEHAVRPAKAERIAMSEVKNRLVEWDLPDFKVILDNR